jgi:hypothetical protein
LSCVYQSTDPSSALKTAQHAIQEAVNVHKEGQEKEAESSNFVATAKAFPFTAKAAVGRREWNYQLGWSWHDPDKMNESGLTGSYLVEALNLKAVICTGDRKTMTIDALGMLDIVADMTLPLKAARKSSKKQKLHPRKHRQQGLRGVISQMDLPSSIILWRRIQISRRGRVQF